MSLTKRKAKKILKDKTVRGKKLTKKQKGFFGAIAGGVSKLKRKVKGKLMRRPKKKIMRRKKRLIKRK